MKVFLVQLRRIKQEDRGYLYLCDVQKSAAPGSRLCHRTFKSEEEMISTLERVLATQSGDRHFSEVHRLITEQGSFQFADLDLTDEQLEELCPQSTSGEQSR